MARGGIGLLSFDSQKFTSLISCLDVLFELAKNTECWLVDSSDIITAVTVSIGLSFCIIFNVTNDIDQISKRCIVSTNFQYAFSAAKTERVLSATGIPVSIASYLLSRDFHALISQS